MRFQINPFTDKLDISGMGPGVTSVDFLTGNSGGPVAADSSYNINVLGDNASGIDTIGNLSPNTLTIFGLASTTIQVGTTRYATNTEAAAQTTGGAALTPANITSLFSTHPLPASQGGTGLSSPAAHQLLVTNGSSAFTLLGVASNGQIPIGSVGSDPVLATITPGSGITVTNGPGTITISAAGSGLSWSDQSGNFNAAVSNGYFITNTSNATLPASPSEGDTVSFIVDTTNILTITANTGQMIRVGSRLSAAAGTCVNNARGDSIVLVYRATGTTWFSQGAPEGTWAVT